MSAWLKSIQAELARVTGDDSVEPDYEGCKHDHVVGVANQDLRRLFWLVLQNKKQSQEAAAAVLSLSGNEREAKLQEASTYDFQADVLTSIFWMSCRHEFPELWNKPYFGLRKGWKVVWTEHGPEGFDIFGALISALDLESLLRDGSDTQSDETKGSKSSRTH